MITGEKLYNAIQEANRFIQKAVIAQNKLSHDEWAQHGCKETGAVKRASMDLTRALAELRK